MIILGITLVALIIGSFLNVVIHRIPIMMQQEWDNQQDTTFNLWWPGSQCPKCHTAIKFWQNIPVISFLLLKGRCNHCQQGISWQYPLVELATLLLTLVLYCFLGFHWNFIYACFFTWGLIALCVIDIKHQLLPDAITLSLLWVGLLANLTGTFTSLSSAVIGAMAGYSALWLFAQGFRLVTGKEGMGHGDFKLLAMIGAWAGWQVLPFVILCSSLIGAIVGALLIITKRQSRGQAIPFGPYLALAGWIGLLFGQGIVDFYLGIAFH